MIEPVETTVVVPLPLPRAFDRFARELGDWWPREYTWGQDVLREIGIEPRREGLCFEVGPHGFRCDWGRVLEWDPPHRLRLTWQIGPRREPVPDPARSSAVTVSFASDGDGRTRVELVHDGFERHGPDGAGYRDAMASPEGWPLIVERFAAEASS